MARQQGQGPLNDPRLVDRRGDLSGLNALMFLLVVLALFLAVGFGLYVFLRGSSNGSPSASPSPSALARSPSPSPVGSLSVSPSLGISPSGAASVGLGSPAPLANAGTPAGTVTVVSTRNPLIVKAKKAPTATRWLVATVEYQATAPLTYDANLWVAVDTTGARHPWAGKDPSPALGTGSLTAGQSVTGTVTFEVPADQAITALVLRDAAGNDIVTVTLPSPLPSPSPSR
jgi:hypothetical protein